MQGHRTAGDASCCDTAGPQLYLEVSKSSKLDQTHVFVLTLVRKALLHDLGEGFIILALLLHRFHTKIHIKNSLPNAQQMKGSIHSKRDSRARAQGVIIATAAGGGGSGSGSLGLKGANSTAFAAYLDFRD